MPARSAEKLSGMKTNTHMSLGHPILILLYSLALLLLGCAIGIHWHDSPWGASKVAFLGAMLMIIHDWMTTTAMFWIAMRRLRKSIKRLPEDSRFTQDRAGNE